MSTYQTILTAIDCSDDSPALLARAASLANSTTDIHLIHVIEPLALAYGADVPMDLSELQGSLIERAHATAEKYASTIGIDKERVYVELGSIEKTIQNKARQIGADLIVVGSHTRSGLALLLGSTARGLVPSAPCDVLAVKVTPKKSTKD